MPPKGWNIPARAAPAAAAPAPVAAPVGTQPAAVARKGWNAAAGGGGGGGAAPAAAMAAVAPQHEDPRLAADIARPMPVATAAAAVPT